jgi:hypothetical protein
MGTFDTKLVRENLRADDSMMSDFTDYVEKCLHRPWRFAIAGSDNLVTEHSMYTSCTLYCKLTAFYIDMELLTSDCILLPIIAAAGFTYFVSICVVGHIFGGCNCSVAVDYLVSALQLCLSQGRTG